MGAGAGAGVVGSGVGVVGGVVGVGGLAGCDSGIKAGSGMREMGMSRVASEGGGGGGVHTSAVALQTQTV
jgi:hypothetical protein